LDGHDLVLSPLVEREMPERTVRRVLSSPFVDKAANFITGLVEEDHPRTLPSTDEGLGILLAAKRASGEPGAVGQNECDTSGGIHDVQSLHGQDGHPLLGETGDGHRDDPGEHDDIADKHPSCERVTRHVTTPVS
jgi:hypothetical protein